MLEFGSFQAIRRIGRSSSFRRMRSGRRSGGRGGELDVSTITASQFVTPNAMNDETNKAFSLLQ